MRKLLVPAALAVVPFALGCSSQPAADAGSDVVSDLSDVASDADRDVPRRVCEAQRTDGGVACHEENVQGSGLFCIRYLCAADDGGATLDDCCRLVG